MWQIQSTNEENMQNEDTDQNVVRHPRFFRFSFSASRDPIKNSQSLKPCMPYEYTSTRTNRCELVVSGWTFSLGQPTTHNPAHNR